MISDILNLFHFQKPCKDGKCLRSHCVCAYETQEGGLD